MVDIEFELEKRGFRPLDIAVLIALADACNFSLKAHQPIQLIAKKLNPALKKIKNNLKMIKKSLDFLKSKGYCSPHVGREKSYGLTKDGLITAKKLTGK